MQHTEVSAGCPRGPQRQRGGGLDEAEVPACLLGGHTHRSLPASAKHRGQDHQIIYCDSAHAQWARMGLEESDSWGPVASVHDSLCKASWKACGHCVHQPGLAGLQWPFLPSLPPSPECASSRFISHIRHLHVPPRSGEQAPAAQAAQATLIRQAQPACLVLPDLAHQHVEGIRHALERGSQLGGGTTARPRAEPQSLPHPALQTGSWALLVSGPRATPLGGLSSAAPPRPTDTCGVLWGHRGCGSRVTAPAWLRAALSWDLHLPQELCRPRPRPWPPSLLGRLGRLTARGAARSWGSQRVPDSPGAGARASALHRGRGGSEPSAHSARPDQAGHPR